MEGEFREGEFLTRDGETALVQRYAPSWVWVVIVRKNGTSITMRLDDGLWRTLRERPVTGEHLTDSAVHQIPRERAVG